MSVKKVLSAGLVSAAFGVTVTAALATPLIMGPGVAPVNVPHVMSVNVVPVQNQLLNSYRSFRSFWVSRAIVR
jgi:hypothetical protein